MAKKKATRLSSKLPLTAAGVLCKADVLERWHQLPAGKLVAPEPRPADATGSSYEEDSIRITGSLKYIDAVLSNLKSLLRCENTKTRLDIAYSQQQKKNTSTPVPGKYVCYIKVVEKVRTTRAKAAVPAPATVRPRVAKPTAQLTLEKPPARHKNIEDAQIALTKLGYKFDEAQRRLQAVIDARGLALTTEEYIKSALNHSK